MKRVELDKEELRKCIEFSIFAAATQQPIEFGQHDTKPRLIDENSRDILIGKIAEVAFAKMLREDYRIAVELDFDIYDRGEYDSQDAEINGWRIDIKATREGGKWLLVEWNKLDFRQKEDRLPHLFVMSSVGWERQIDQPKGWVDLVGGISIKRLCRSGRGVHVLRKGDCIPGTGSRLQADNYGVHFDDLEQDWDTIIFVMENQTPPSTDRYLNPYTNETTLCVLHQES